MRWLTAIATPIPDSRATCMQRPTASSASVPILSNGLLASSLGQGRDAGSVQCARSSCSARPESGKVLQWACGRTECAASLWNEGSRKQGALSAHLRRRAQAR